MCLVLATALLAAGCGSATGDDGGNLAQPSPTATPAPSPTREPASTPMSGSSGYALGDTGAGEQAATPSPTMNGPEAPGWTPPAVVEDLVGRGAGVRRPAPAARMPEGWSEREYAFGGTARSWEAVGEIPADGRWEVREADRAPYRSRMIVRTPPEAEFSGVVLVEWLNVTSGTDINPDWNYLAEEIGRAGHAWVGVSAQAVGVNGTDNALVDSGFIDTRGLKVIDPERYGDLEHPGDPFSFDIFTQAGAALAGPDAVEVLDGLEADHVVAIGESQSAAFLTTYLNAIHPLVELYDGFLVHSRGSFGPAPSSARVDDGAGGVPIRDDLDAPVMIYETETDLTVLGYATARQPDTDTVRTWEVAGTAHADVYSITAAAGLPRQPQVGKILGCSTPINDGPQHETLQAALHHLVAWVVDGTLPPASPRIELDGEAIERDELGIAVGGIRTPPVDAPLRVLSGDPGPDGGACVLFGQTQPIAAELLAELYPDLATYVEALETSARTAVDAGWLLAADAETMVSEETARAVELGLE